jgi:hypothetical protein
VAAVVLFASVAAGEAMPNDPLPLPDISADYPGRDSVHSQIVAVGRERSLVTEYPSRAHRSEADKVADTIGRLKPTAQDDAPAPAYFTRRLADLRATIEQIEAVLKASETSTPEVHFAVERIQDMTFSLRQHDVEPALCDTLEAAIREVGDAIVRSDVVAARAMGAAAQLQDLARCVNDMIGKFGDAADGVDDPAPGSTAESVDARSSEAEAAASPFQSLPAPAALPAAETPKAAVDLFELASLPIPSPLDGSKDTGRARNDEGKAASELFSGNAAASDFAASDSVGGKPQSGAASPHTPPAVDLSSPAATNHRAALREPNATFPGLSEEELVALFS